MPSRSRFTPSRICDPVRTSSPPENIRRHPAWPGSIQRILRLCVVLVLSVAWLPVIAAPAQADPAVPTNYRSIVTGTDPETDGVTFDVVGGDSFLEVSAVPGHKVMLPGYFDEPYIRIEPDGVVWVNENSPAHYINRDRYGDVPIPEGVSREAAAEWVQVADDGRYAWHDHRVHWMSYDLPPTAGGNSPDLVFPWEVPFSIDGQDGNVLGQLVWIPSGSPIAPLLAGSIALLPLAIWGRQRVEPMAALLGTAGVVATGVGLAQMLGTPASARVVPFELIFSLIAVVCSGLMLVIRTTRPPTARWLAFVGGLSRLAWAIANLPTLWMPVLPSTMPSGLERAGVAFVLWASIGISLSAAATILNTRQVLAKS